MFNRGEFYDAHEVLEDVWRAAPLDEKKFLQGLIQIAVGLHHSSTGNVTGARSLLERGAQNLAGYPAKYAQIDVAGLLAIITRWTAALAEGSQLPHRPRIKMIV